MWNSSVLLQLERNPFPGNLSENSFITMITLLKSSWSCWYLKTFTGMGRNDEHVSALKAKVKYFPRGTATEWPIPPVGSFILLEFALVPTSMDIRDGD
jgi:hypothetical protein